MGFLQRLKASVGNLMSVGSPGFMVNLISASGNPPRRRGEEYLEAYSTMPWLRAVAHKVAHAVATSEWELRVVSVGQDVDTADTYTKPHPFRDLLTKGIPHVLTGYQSWLLTQLMLDLRGETFWLLQRNGAGAPTEAWPCPSNWVLRTPIFGSTDPYAQTYRIALPRGVEMSVPATEVVWFKEPDPRWPYNRGVGTAESVGEELTIDQNASRFMSRYFLNNARPDLIVSGPSLSPAQTARLEEDWRRKNQGVFNALGTYFMNAKVDIKELAANFQHLQMIDLRRNERDTIFQVFGIPPEIMGVTEHANRATIETADFIFAKYVLTPRLTLLDSVLNARLAPEYDERLRIVHDDPIPENRQELVKEHLDPNAGQIFTVNERRKALGYPEIQGGDVFFVPVNLSPMEQLSTEARRGEEAPGAPIQEPTLEDVEAQGPEVPSGRGFRVPPNVRALPVGRRKADDAPEPAAPPVDPDHLLNDLERRREITLMLERLQPIYRQIVVESGTAALTEVGVSDVFSVVNPHVLTFLHTTAPRLIRDINDTTWQALRDALAEGIAEGETMVQLADRVSQVFESAKGPRAQTIARTESTRAANTGALEGYRQSGVVEKKEWLTAEDEKVDDECQAAEDAGPIPLDETFPGGYDEPPIHPNCFAAGTSVMAPWLLAAMSRHYAGAMVELETRSGARLTVTPNHPLLTPNGWVPAGSLHEGSNLLRSVDGQWMATMIDPYHQHVPAMIEQVAETLRHTFPMATIRMPSSPEDFHGDGKGSEVYVVTPNGLLWNGLDPQFTQPRRQLTLQTRNRRLQGLPSQRDSLAMQRRLSFPAYRIVGSSGIGAALLRSPLCSQQAVRFETITMRNARIAQSAVEPCTVTPKFGGEPFRRFSSKISTNNVLGQRTPALQWHARNLDTPIEGVTADPNLLRQLAVGSAGLVTTDQIIKIRQIQFCGHVYNLESNIGWYLADGIIAHNCRCALSPVVSDDGEERSFYPTAELKDKAWALRESSRIQWERMLLRELKRAFQDQQGRLQRRLRASRSLVAVG